MLLSILTCGLVSGVNYTTAVSSDFTLTSQVTIKVPHNATNGFTVNNLTSRVTGTSWTVAGRDDGVVEGANTYDYISFFVSFPGGNNAYKWKTNNAELRVFTFQNSGACSGSIELMDNANDPFWGQGTLNHGNQIDVLIDGDIYSGRYGTGTANCATADTDGDGVLDNDEDRNSDGDFSNDDTDGDLANLVPGVAALIATLAGFDNSCLDLHPYFAF